MASRSPTIDLKDQTSSQTPKRGPAHERLEAFVGNWKIEGRNGEGAGRAANTRVTGHESYEWLPGRFFLVYRWDRQFGDTQHTGIAIIAYDESRNAYTARFFDNLGYARIYDATVRDRVLTLTGAQERASISVSGGIMMTHWERTSDGVHWRPLCDLTGTNVT
jgi:hypothetical protein